jgi:hypothetical protein
LRDVQLLCFGNDNKPEEEALCSVDQSGLNKFQGLYTATTPEQHPQAGVEVVLLMLPFVHQQGAIHIFVGEGSIEKQFLLRKSLVNKSAIITGRTLLRLAKEVLCNCKKMMAIATSSTSPYKDGNFPSGTNWDDYARWCLKSMYQNEEQQTRNKKQADLSFNDEQPQENDKEDGEQTPDAGNNCPQGYFFKGYLAWSLWGHIPIVDSGSTTMQSSLFGDGKMGTSFGRKTGLGERLVPTKFLRKPLVVVLLKTLNQLYQQTFSSKFQVLPGPGAQVGEWGT